MNFIVNPKNYSQVRDIATENGLDVKELTSGSNGYPKNLRLRVTGFPSFDDAEAFADKYNGKVTSIRKRDGWSLSESQGNMYFPFSHYDIEHDGEVTEVHYTFDVWTYDVAVEFNPLHIRNLNDLADYINSCEGYPEGIEEICEENFWGLMDDNWHICNDGEEQVLFDDNGVAVVTEYCEKC